MTLLITFIGMIDCKIGHEDTRKNIHTQFNSFYHSGRKSKLAPFFTNFFPEHTMGEAVKSCLLNVAYDAFGFLYRVIKNKHFQNTLLSGSQKSILCTLLIMTLLTIMDNP